MNARQTTNNSVALSGNPPINMPSIVNAPAMETSIDNKIETSVKIEDHSTEEKVEDRPKSHLNKSQLAIEKQQSATVEMASRKESPQEVQKEDKTPARRAPSVDPVTTVAVMKIDENKSENKSFINEAED